MYMLYTWWYLTDFWGFTHFYFFLPIPQTKVSIETSLFSISLIFRSANSNLLLWFSHEYLISVILLFQLCIFYLIILSNLKLFIFILYLVFSKEESVIDSINHRISQRLQWEKYTVDIQTTQLWSVDRIKSLCIKEVWQLTSYKPCPNWGFYYFFFACILLVYMLSMDKFIW